MNIRYTDNHKRISIGDIPTEIGNVYVLDYDRSPIDKIKFELKVFEDYITLGANEIFIDKHKTKFGERRLFICPYCSEDREHLYYVNGHWKCRACGKLRYRSTVTYRNGMDYCDLKINKILEKLKVERDISYYTGDLIPYVKPKGMRWSTYSTLIKELRYWQCERYNRWLNLVSIYLKR